MRRVVVTGIGLLSPLGGGVEHGWKQLLAGQQRRTRITEFDVDRLCLQDRACRCRAATAATAPSIRRLVLEPKEQRKIGDFILYGDRRRRRGAGGFRLGAEDARTSAAHRRHDRLRHRRPRRHRRERASSCSERGPRRISPFFIPGPHQPRLRPGLDPPRAARARTMRSSPPAPPARTPSATRPG